MAISAAAKSNHDQLFGDRVSTLAQSDPELIEYFGNFAFDEVYADAARLDETLDLHTRLMVQLAAILATGGLAEFRVVAASSAPTPWPLASRTPPWTRCTSSDTWPLTASATPSGAAASTWRCASCSRSRCSSPWAVPTLRCAGTSTETSGSATPARGCSPC